MQDTHREFDELAVAPAGAMQALFTALNSSQAERKSERDDAKQRVGVIYWIAMLARSRCLCCHILYTKEDYLMASIIKLSTHKSVLNARLSAALESLDTAQYKLSNIREVKEKAALLLLNNSLGTSLRELRARLDEAFADRDHAGKRSDMSTRVGAKYTLL